MVKKFKRIHLKHTDAFDNWHWGSVTNGVRSRLATQHFLELVDRDLVNVKTPSTTETHLDRAVETYGVHGREYVDRVLAGYSDEWSEVAWDDHRPDLAVLAKQMFNGTAELVQDVRPGDLGINWQGAKHHAMYDQSSGFCVFNDMAYAARLLAAHGQHVLYLDWDAHHGDGVEALTRTTHRIVTFSIHQRGIFPGTGNVDSPTQRVYNRALEAGAGDEGLVAAVKKALGPTVMASSTSTILLAAGADGALGDPLSKLGYTLDGYAEAARMVGEIAKSMGARVIMGGAGGYRPEDLTPQVWAHTAHVLADTMGLLNE